MQKGGTNSMEYTESASKWNKLFSFNWKKDIWWILFIVALLFTAWAYKRDIGGCQDIAMNPCAYCYYQDNAAEMLAKYPTASLQCNWVGVPADQFGLQGLNLSGMNLSNLGGSS